MIVDERCEQPLLVFEVDVKRALGDAGRKRNLRHAGAVEALGKENLTRALQDLRPLVAFRASPFPGNRRIRHKTPVKSNRTVRFSVDLTF